MPELSLVRRVLAMLALASLTNLMFVQGGQACPATADGSTMSTHGAHEAGLPPGSPMAQESAPDAPGHSPCPMMGPCALTLDVSPLADAATRDQAQAMVIGVSEHLPASRSTAPALPPPRV